MGKRGGGGIAVLIDLRTVAETTSTNDDMVALAREGAREDVWLRADRQTAGRGRLGRGWMSQPGNLHVSTLVRLRAADPPAPTLALVAGVALHEALAMFAPDAGLRLKWPNDVLTGDAKLAGILLERHGDAVVIGCGANLAHHPTLPDRTTTAIAALAGTAPAPHVVAETLAEIFARWLARWRAEGLAPVIAAWLDAAHPIGAALQVTPPGEAPLTGLFDGLDDIGALRLRLADGTARVIHAGDVFLARD